MRLIDTLELLQALSTHAQAFSAALRNDRNILPKETFLDLISALDQAFQAGLFASLKPQYEEFRIQLGEHRECCVPTKGQLTSFLRFSEKIRELCTHLEEGMRLSVQELPSHSISVKLPDIVSLNQLSRFATNLDKILMQTVTHEQIGGAPRILNFDSGSLWIDISIGTHEGIKLLGGIAWAALAVRNKELASRKMIEELQEMQLDEEALSKVIETQKTYADQMVDHESQSLASQLIGEDVSPEYVQRIRFAVKEMASLVHSGMEMRCKLTEGADVQKTFPDFAKALLVESKQNLLSEAEVIAEAHSSA